MYFVNITSCRISKNIRFYVLIQIYLLPAHRHEYIFVCTPAYRDKLINPIHILEVNEMDLLIEFAKMGIGVSCVVKQFVEEELNTGSLIEIELSRPIAPCEIGFLYNRIRPMNENVLKFIGMA